MTIKEVKLTAQGKADLEKELRYLKTVKRQEVSARIKEAISLGDISENAEYDEAKNEQGSVELRISTLEDTLNHVSIIEELHNSDTVLLGSTVRLRDVEFDEVEKYIIVGPAEANPRRGRLSNESPVGLAILGKKKGETVEVQVPIGVIKYEIIEIE